MFTDKKNILQLLAVLKGFGISKVVLCPGSRNIPLVRSFLSEPFFECYSVTDERGAGFFAIGISLRGGQGPEPVIVCCTSGTAVANLYPAVAEAYYQNIPLVIVSADRPAEWIGQMDGQTLPQSGIFGGLIKRAVNLPIVKNMADEWYCNRLVNEALLELNHYGVGPVHINLPIDEPLFDFNATKLPVARVIRRYGDMTNSFGNAESIENLIDKTCNFEKRMIICGQTPPSAFDFDPVDILKDSFVCISEQLGNNVFADNALCNFDIALYTMDETQKESFAPDLLITFGGHIVSKRLKSLLRKYKPKEHWHISMSGEVVDLYCSLTTVIEMQPACFLNMLAEHERVLAGMMSDHCKLQYFTYKWRGYCSALPTPHFDYSAMGAIEALIDNLPLGSALHISNSSSVRYAQMFDLHKNIRVFCNRGTNGIEGSLSSAVGYAASSTALLSFVIIGDLSFFYDMNALWNTQIGSNLRVMMLNNGGGEIFHSLPGLNMDARARSFITATHTTTAKGWAEERGFDYIGVHNAGDLKEALLEFTSIKQCERPMFMEVFTLADEDIRLLKTFYHNCRQTMIEHDFEACQ